MSTITQRVTLKSPKMSIDDDKQSNYRLMNVLCRTKAIFADFQISKVINDRRKKRYDFPIDFSPTCVSLNVEFSIPTANLESFSHFLPFLINQLA